MSFMWVLDSKSIKNHHAVFFIMQNFEFHLVLKFRIHCKIHFEECTSSELMCLLGIIIWIRESCYVHTWPWLTGNISRTWLQTSVWKILSLFFLKMSLYHVNELFYDNFYYEEAPSKKLTLYFVLLKFYFEFEKLWTIVSLFIAGS